MNRLSTNAIQPITLAVDDIECNREALRQAMDEVEEQAKHSDSGKKLVYAEDLDDVIKLNIGFKTIHILGQVLRSFPGDLHKNLKIEIAPGPAYS
jgi:hypothetical protein